MVLSSEYDDVLPSAVGESCDNVGRDYDFMVQHRYPTMLFPPYITVINFPLAFLMPYKLCVFFGKNVIENLILL